MSKEELYIGIMSGTSLDGIDVVICKIDSKSCTLIENIFEPFSSELKYEVLELINGSCLLEDLGSVDHKLALEYSKAVDKVLKKSKLDSTNITAIGMHGQTVWHNPNSNTPFSMQLGDANLLTVKSNIKVVSDFRRKNMALGGQGAPFAPAFHEFLFGSNSSMSVVNIGGMANITVLEENLIGYDTGCGNVLLDLWAKKSISQDYDENGNWAKRGSVDFSLLENMLQEEFFNLPSPKSTGRELFNESWLNRKLKDKSIKAVDVQRTLLELTAITISNEVLKYNKDILMLCGGGVHNGFLVERLSALIPNIQIVISNDADNLEAMLVAWLAYKRVNSEVVNLKDVTGATKNAILGALYE